ncbi:MAG: serine/threonine protein kinase [Gammaproteobacteria bacterium]|nr:serine/threonine protein kinase [Gammaproteobacteria bacterium]
MTTEDLISVPGYTVHRLLGKGGMAAVYLATQNSLEREVAIKVLLNPGDEQFNQRFVSEARIIATLNHPRVITVYDVAQLDDGRHYIAMEYLSGGDLSRLRGQMLGPMYALELIRQIAEGLSVVHRRGIIHRDIKPANILFREDGTVVLTDFGIAKDLQQDCDLTQAGVSVGSPSYSSPEQSYCQPLDQRADIYSLGVILLELLVGSNPFKGDNFTQTILNHAQMPVPELPAPLRQYQNLLNRMLAKNPAERFASTDELLTVLTDLVHGQMAPSDLSITRQHFAPARSPEPEQTGRKIVFALAVTLLLALLGGGIFWYTYESETERKVNDLLALAEQRLTEAKLTEPEFDNARYYFNEVLVFDPQNTAALEGLERVRQQQITQLLKLGAERFEQQRLTRPLRDNAYFYYQQVLLLDPESAVARDGLSRITTEYITLAQEAFGGRDYGAGHNYVNLGLEVEPENATLLELKDRYKYQSNAIQRFFNRVFN